MDKSEPAETTDMPVDISLDISPDVSLHISLHISPDISVPHSASATGSVHLDTPFSNDLVIAGVTKAGPITTMVSRVKPLGTIRGEIAEATTEPLSNFGTRQDNLPSSSPNHLRFQALSITEVTDVGHAKKDEENVDIPLPLHIQPKPNRHPTIRIHFMRHGDVCYHD
jgi:hypothetical protein